MEELAQNTVANPEKQGQNTSENLPENLRWLHRRRLTLCVIHARQPSAQRSKYKIRNFAAA
jgi:hypothetical protein